MTYAIQRSVRLFSEAPFIGEALTGLSYFQFVRDLAREIDKKLPALIEKFLQLKSTLFHFTSPHLIISGDEDQYRMLSKESFFGIHSLPSKPFTEWKGFSLPSSAESEAYPISSPVAFSAFGVKGRTHSPALSIATDLMENTYLHRKVREQGGAYGGGANYNPMTGNFYFYAYRDPQIQATFQAFGEGLIRMIKGKFNEKDLDKKMVDFNSCLL